MEKKNRGLIFSFIVLVIFGLLLGGCVPGDGVVDKNYNPVGVSASFVAGSPPDVLKEERTFAVSVRLENGADINVKEGRVCVRGISRGYGGFSDEQCADFSLLPIVAEGKQVRKAYDILRFQSDGYSLRERNIDETFVAKATYLCELITGPQFCVSNRITDEDSDIDCPRIEVFTGAKVSTTTAPITLTKVEKEFYSGGDGVMLSATLTLKKVNDGGYVVNSIDDKETEKEYVDIQVSYAGYGDMRCDSVRNGKLEWNRNENEKVIKCDISLGDVGERQSSSLDVRLRYYYRVKEQKSVKIEKVMEYDSGGGEF